MSGEVVTDVPRGPTATRGRAEHGRDTEIADPEPSFGGRVLQVVLVVVGTVLAVGLGVLVPDVGLTSMIIVIGGLAGVGVLSYLALHRFEWLIWTVLLVRPLLDLTKSSKAAGSVGSTSGMLATLFGGAIIVAGGVYVAALSRRGERLPLGLISRALLLLMVTSIPSIAGSSEPATSALQTARTLGAVVLFVVLEQMLRTRRLALRALTVCGIAAAVPVGIGLFQKVSGSTHSTTKEGVARLTASFLHPNSFGFFLVLVLVVGYCLRFYVTRRIRWAIDVGLVVAAVDLVFTYSRGSWLTLVVAALVVGFLFDRRILVGLPLVLVVAFVAVTSVRERVLNLLSPNSVAGSPTNSASWRVDHARELLSDTHGQTLFGIGPKMADTLTEGGRAPHNDVVRMIVENGLVGLTFYLLFLIGLVALAWRALKRCPEGFGRGLAVSYTAVVVAFVINSMGANLISQFLLLMFVLTYAAIVQAWTNNPVIPPVAVQGSTLLGQGDLPGSRLITKKDRRHADS